ncbi:hypothetical protein HYX70_01610 [Candidatus Saccharibacteria bacterium]|nr:hypothetical protein [Candidatus Saccharibacteria bacterium]
MSSKDWLGKPHQLYIPQPIECKLADMLQAECMIMIEQLGGEAAAPTLGLAPCGVDRLCWEPKWDLRVAVRAAEVLEVPLLEAVKALLDERSSE